MDFDGAEFLAGGVVTVILGALGDKEVQIHELSDSDAVFKEGVDDLDEELVEFLARDGADFEMVEALNEQVGDLIWDGGLGDV